MRGTLKRLVVGVLVAAVAWPALREYRAGYCLAEAGALIEGVLLGRSRGAAAQDAVRRAEERLVCAQPMAAREPTRLAMLQALNLMLAGRPDVAEQRLREAIALGERPELVLNLGRALAAQGDEAGARKAFLRAMWAAPQVADTLPRGVRATLSVELQAMEQALREGHGVLPSLPP